VFCDHCGSPIQPDHRFCAKCGKTILDAADPYYAARFERHLHLLGIFWIIAGALWLLPSFAMMTIGSVGGLAMWPMGPFHHGFFPPLMFGFGGGLLIIAAAGICIGWGIIQREPWARTAAIILGILAVFHPPFGTALGIYTLWVLLSNHAGAAYDGMARTR
jgi:predicted nucleic acid-binding Zn ribbon protein